MDKQDLPDLKQLSKQLQKTEEEIDTWLEEEIDISNEQEELQIVEHHLGNINTSLVEDKKSKHELPFIIWNAQDWMGFDTIRRCQIVADRFIGHFRATECLEYFNKASFSGSSVINMPNSSYLI